MGMNRLKLFSLAFSALLLTFSLAASAVTCTLTCQVSEDAVVAEGYPSAEFTAYCKGLGGRVVFSGGAKVTCVTFGRHFETVYGSGNSSYEASRAANNACYQYNCSRNCPPPYVIRTGVPSSPKCSSK